MALAFCLSACSSVMRSGAGPEPGAPALPPPRYSIIFVVHGDGDYLFHDTSGRALQADEEEVAAAKRVAERNPEAEVFIFHQQRRRRTLFLFPRRGGRFYFYRGGRLIAEEKYRRGQGASRFHPEKELYTRFRSQQHAQASTLFLYSGHEIPEFDRRGYDLSMRKQTFGVDDLASALASFTQAAGKVDLMVLSTCFGGTPYTIGKLAPFARTIVASPDNLHLSYFDLQPLEHLKFPATGAGVADLTADFARHAFDELSEEVQTAVTVAVYETDHVQEYVAATLPVYQQMLNALSGPGTLQRIDCATEPAYSDPAISKGVEIFYRPPRFGRAKGTMNRSGWECWAPQTPAGETSRETQNSRN